MGGNRHYPFLGWSYGYTRGFLNICLTRQWLCVFRYDLLIDVSFDPNLSRFYYPQAISVWVWVSQFCSLSWLVFSACLSLSHLFVLCGDLCFMRFWSLFQEPFLHALMRGFGHFWRLHWFRCPDTRDVLPFTRRILRLLDPWEFLRFSFNRTFLRWFVCHLFDDHVRVPCWELWDVKYEKMISHKTWNVLKSFPFPRLWYSLFLLLLVLTLVDLGSDGWRF